MQRETRTDAGHQEIAEIRQIESVYDHECGVVEIPDRKPAIDLVAQHNEKDIVGKIGDLKDLREQGMGKLRNPDGRVDAEHRPVDGDEDMIVIDRMDRPDHEIDLLEDKEHDRITIPSMESDPKPRWLSFRLAGKRQDAPDADQVDKHEPGPNIKSGRKDEAKKNEERKESDGNDVQRG